tara:strand:- start:1177 stop:1494 length:318 start_codon:yes stop_codon:yes gene_type:complete
MAEEELPKSPNNEGEYIEMANHLKKLYEEIDKKNKKIMGEKQELIKVLLSSYGLIRVIDNYVSNVYDIPNDLVVLIETLRGSLSDELDTFIFNINKITLDDLEMI